RAHLSRASTAGRQQSKSVARGEGPQLGGARDSAAPRFGNARLSIAVQIDGIRRTWTYVIRELTIIDATIEDRQIGASEMHQILPDHNSAGEMFSGPLQNRTLLIGRHQMREDQQPFTSAGQGPRASAAVSA